MKILLINSLSGIASTGRIVDGIARSVNSFDGNQSFVAYGLQTSSFPHAYKIGHTTTQFLHKVITHAFDMQGLGSYFATRRFIDYIKSINPDIIHLHTIHGNYLNYPVLFNFLRTYKHPVVWTLHDCWSFTGHCPHFAYSKCEKWKSQCYNCPNLSMYPKSEFWDGSKRNYRLKKKFFLSVASFLTLVTPSLWLAELVRESFFRDVKVEVIPNGIDTTVFTRCNVGNEFYMKYNLSTDKKIVLGVSSPWHDKKGYSDFIRLRSILSDEYVIVLVGVSKEQKELLPSGVIGILRTENIFELAQLYSVANVFVNLTYEDTYPTVNLEALSCGTPIITYKTGGSPESLLSDNFGEVVPQGSIHSVKEAIFKWCNVKKDERICLSRQAVHFFDQSIRFANYLELYKSIFS